MHFISLPLHSIIAELGVKQSGLSEAEVVKKIAKFGKNISYTRQSKNFFQVFLSQFLSPLIIILLLISAVSLFVGEHVNGIIILGMLVVNAIIGATQEMKAEKSLDKLAKLVVFKVRVIRDGIVKEILQEELVPGDTVLLKTGDVIGADIRLVESRNLLVNESVLTGESLPVYKNVEKDGEQETIPQNIKASVFMGCAVVGGNAKGIVIHTGKNTFLGQSVGIAEQTQPTKFERDLKKFSDGLLIFVLIFSSITGVINVFLGRDLVTALMLGVTLALGITPEILPVVVTVALSAGAFALAKKKVIVRRLTALEDLGNVNVLCTDKTGTLTTGVLEVHAALSADGKANENVLKFGYLCSAVFPGFLEFTTPNSLDDAILAAIPHDLLPKAEGIDVADFDFNKKTMAALVTMGRKGQYAIKKGATEAVLAACKYVKLGARTVVLSEKRLIQIKNKVHKYEREGYRVISVAAKPVPDETKAVFDDHDMQYQGFIVFKDPPKSDVAGNIENLERLRIKVKIISGDSAEVTKQIARKVGLHVEDEHLISGAQIDKMSLFELQQAVSSHDYFVRVTPRHKQQIIEALQLNGDVVAYMGDGINDVGALRVADVGISVENATPITKDVADFLLLEKNLSALSNAVLAGRMTFTNTVKFITNTMSSSLGNVITAALASLFLPFIPLLPAQLLLIDSISDLQHLSFATDSVDTEMTRLPKSWNQGFMMKFILVFGIVSTVFDFVHISIFSMVARTPELFRTLWFVESILTEMLATFAIRTQRFMFKSRPSNSLLLVTLGAVFIAILIPIIPFLNTMLGFVSLNVTQFLIIFAVVLSYILTLETVKYFFYRSLRDPKAKTLKI